MFEFECRVSRTALSEGSGHHAQLDLGGRSNQMVQKYSLLGIWKQRDEDNSTQIRTPWTSGWWISELLANCWWLVVRYGKHQAVESIVMLLEACFWKEIWIPYIDTFHPSTAGTSCWDWLHPTQHALLLTKTFRRGAGLDYYPLPSRGQTGVLNHTDWCDWAMVDPTNGNYSLLKCHSTNIQKCHVIIYLYI